MLFTAKTETLSWSELFNPPEPRYQPIEQKTIWEMIGEKIGESFNSFVLNGLETAVIKFLAGLPIMLGVSIGVYALISMFSKTLARYGVIVVFIYGTIVAIFV